MAKKTYKKTRKKKFKLSISKEKNLNYTKKKYKQLISKKRSKKKRAT